MGKYIILVDKKPLWFKKAARCVHIVINNKLLIIGYILYNIAYYYVN